MVPKLGYTYDCLSRCHHIWNRHLLIRYFLRVYIRFHERAFLSQLISSWTSTSKSKRFSACESKMFSINGRSKNAANKNLMELYLHYYTLNCFFWYICLKVGLIVKLKNIRYSPLIYYPALKHSRLFHNMIIRPISLDRQRGLGCWVNVQLLH